MPASLRGNGALGLGDGHSEDNPMRSKKSAAAFGVALPPIEQYRMPAAVRDRVQQLSDAVARRLVDRELGVYEGLLGRGWTWRSRWLHHPHAEARFRFEGWEAVLRIGSAPPVQLDVRGDGTAIDVLDGIDTRTGDAA